MSGPHFHDVVADLAHGRHWALIGLWLWLHAVDAISFFAGALIAFRLAPAAERAGGFFRFALPRRSIVSRSAFADYLFVIVPRLFGRESMVPVLIGAFALAALVRPLTVPLFGAYAPAAHAGIGMQALFVAGWVLATDFGIYVSHLARHRVPLLWEFHKVHHCAEALNPATALRCHPLDSFLQDISACVCAALFIAVYGRFVEMGLVHTAYLGVDAVLLSRLVTLGHLRHSHIAMHFPGWMDWLFISPVNHQLHHSADPAHYDRNLGNVFAVWDRLFGTFLAARPGQRFHFGIAEVDLRAFGDHNFLLLLLVPFRNAARRLLPGRARPGGTPAPGPAAA